MESIRVFFVAHLYIPAPSSRGAKNKNPKGGGIDTV